MPRQNDKILSFQGLRGIAQLLIIISHCNVVVNSNGENIFKYFGSLGVTLFIILSGFLEMKSLESRQETYKARLKRKISNFYWLHIFTLIIALPLSLLGFKMQNLAKYIFTLLCNLVLIQSWIPVKSVYFSFNAVSWYLSTMILFIVIAPVIFKIIKKLTSLAHILIVGFCGIFEIIVFVIMQKIWGGVYTLDSIYLPDCAMY